MPLEGTNRYLFFLFNMLLEISFSFSSLLKLVQTNNVSKQQKTKQNKNIDDYSLVSSSTECKCFFTVLKQEQSRLMEI